MGKEFRWVWNWVGGSVKRGWRKGICKLGTFPDKELFTSPNHIWVLIIGKQWEIFFPHQDVSRNISQHQIDRKGKIGEEGFLQRKIRYWVKVAEGSSNCFLKSNSERKKIRDGEREKKNCTSLCSEEMDCFKTFWENKKSFSRLSTLAEKKFYFKGDLGKDRSLI